MTFDLFGPQLNLWLQSFQTAWLTALLLIISALGSAVFLTAAAGFVLFYRELKKGVILLQLLLWSSLVSDFLKSTLSLPRPTDVHPSVSLLEDQYPQWLLEIFPLRMNFGFPSGHVWATTVFWGAMMFLFPGRSQKIAGTILICLMPLSRMYLGRHFLFDVLGGLIFGLMTVFIGKYLLLPLFRGSTDPTPEFFPLRNQTSVALSSYLLVLPLLLLPVVHFPAGDVGKLYGVNLAFFVLLISGLPQERSGPAAGLARLFVSTFLYLSLKLLFRFAGFHLYGSTWLDVLDDAIPGFISLWGAVEISKRLGLYLR